MIQVAHLQVQGRALHSLVLQRSYDDMNYKHLIFAQEVMVQATLCIGDGHSYDQSAISQWLQTHSTSPVTGQPLTTTELLPNYTLRQVIEDAGR